MKRRREEGGERKEEAERRVEKPFGRRMNESYEEGKGVDENKVRENVFLLWIIL